MDTIPALFAAPLNNLIMSKYDVFGVKLTSLEVMRFSKYTENNKIAMNTLQPNERSEIVKNWLTGINIPD